METEMQHLETMPSLSLSSRLGSAASSSWADVTDPKYTSLRDLLLRSPPSVHDGGSLADFDAAALPIRNQLVKHAASAYLQSASIHVARNQSCLSRLWRRMRRRATAVGSACFGCAHGPVVLVSGSVRSFMAGLASPVRTRISRSVPRA